MTEPARNPLLTICRIALDLVSLTFSAMRSRARLAAENLFLRKQLAFRKRNTFCERLIGTIRRECLDFVAPRPRREETVM
jgi:hypothetical protein